MKAKVDPKLKHVFDQAFEIIHANEKLLLQYSEYKNLTQAMYNIKEVTISKRAVRRRGCVKRLNSRDVLISISEYMLILPQQELLTTIVHEILHCFKDSKGHEGQWKWRAAKLKETTGLNITRVRTIENEYQYRKQYDQNRASKSGSRQRCINKRIVCRCDKCGLELVRTKETNFTKNPQRYSHSGCNGHFERIGVML